MGKYLDKVRQHEHGEPVPTIDPRQAVPVPPPTIQAGDTITWQRGGQGQQGLVDFIHVDDTGTRWAFVTLADGTCAAINCKCSKVAT